jgi:hypothetical protein
MSTFSTVIIEGGTETKDRDFGSEDQATTRADELRKQGKKVKVVHRTSDGKVHDH